MVEDKIESASQLVHYILKKIGQIDKLKVIKLAFMADKLHLLRLGRTISNDTFWAMPHGPVGSNVKRIVDLDLDHLDQNSIEYLKDIFQYGPDDKISIKKDIDYDLLSESDKSIVDSMVNKFGQWSTMGKLIPYLHDFPEWFVHEGAVQASEYKSVPIKISELFSTPTKDFEVDNDIIRLSRDMLFGNV